MVSLCTADLARSQPYPGPELWVWASDWVCKRSNRGTRPWKGQFQAALDTKREPFAVAS